MRTAARRTLALAVTASAYAGPACAIDLWEVAQLAAQHDAEFLAAQHTYNATREVHTQAVADLLPTVAFQGDYSEAKQNIAKSDNPLYPEGWSGYPSDSVALTVKQPLFNWGALKRLEQTRSVLAAAEAEFNIARQDMIVRATERYFALLAAQDDVEFVRAEMKSFAGHEQLAREKHDRGFASMVDVLQAQARLRATEADELKALNVLEDARQGVREVAGLAPDAVATLGEDVPMSPPLPEGVEFWSSAAQTQNWSVRAASFAMEAAHKEIIRRSAGHFPTLDLIGRLSNRDTGGSTFGAAGGTRIETGELTLSLSLPLYQGGRVSSETRQAAELYLKAEQERFRQQRAVDREVRAAYQSVLNAIARVRALRSAIQAQELAVQAKRAGYEKGVSSSIEVLDAGRDLYSVRKDCANARYEYVLSMLKLQRATGALGEADVQQANRWLSSRETHSPVRFVRGER